MGDARQELDPPGSIGHLVRFLAPELWEEGLCPTWPPDAFGLAAAILMDSGAYSEVVADWPPRPPSGPPGKGGKGSDTWVKFIRKLGDRWRSMAVDGKAPKQVREWWEAIRTGGAVPLAALHGRQQKALREALLQLMAAADEACCELGIPVRAATRRPAGQSKAQRFKELSGDLLYESFGRGSTLCRRMLPSHLQVLPSPGFAEAAHSSKRADDPLPLSPRGTLPFRRSHRPVAVYPDRPQRRA